jgi:hypothetical protein
MFKLKLPGRHDDTTRDAEPNPIPERVPTPLPADDPLRESPPTDRVPMASPLAGTPEPDAGTLLGSDDGDAQGSNACLHGVRIAHWENPADMGRTDRASFFVCESCGAALSPDENRMLDPAAPVRAADE